MLQAWDFVPGTNFIDLMDRGVSGTTIVISVLSRHYMTSRFGRLEWQAAMRANPDDPAIKLVTVRVEDCPVDGLLATITYLDLVDVTDAARARRLLLDRVAQAQAGRAKLGPAARFPNGADPDQPDGLAAQHPFSRPSRRPPVYPAASLVSRTSLNILHLAGPAFSVEDPETVVGDFRSRLQEDLDRLVRGGCPEPDLMVVTGNLTASAKIAEFARAMKFLAGMRNFLGLDPGRLVITPGETDVSRAACLAYFAHCESDDVALRPPYWPKWKHYERAFDELYRDIDGVSFTSDQPWTLFAMPELRLMVAGLNATMALSHLPEHQHGLLGQPQAAWFARRLQAYENVGWLRIGAISRLDGGTWPRDNDELARVTARLNLVLHGSGDGLVAQGTGDAEAVAGDAGTPPGDIPVLSASQPGTYEMVSVTSQGITRWPSRPDPVVGPPLRLSYEFRGATGTFQSRAAERSPEAQPEFEVRAVPSPAAQLLDRIAEICRVRFERPEVRHVAGDPPYLLVDYVESDVARRRCLTARVGDVTRQHVEAFREQAYVENVDQPVDLVYQGDRPSRELRDEALRAGVRLRSFLEFQGLLDLGTYIDAQTMRLRRDRQYPPDLYVPQRFREIERRDQPVREGLVEELVKLLNAPHGRFILLLGDFGRGKTFALRQLALQISATPGSPIPILIDMRNLDKSHSVDGLVAAHLATHGEDAIDLKAFRYMLQRGRIVLLFDGFDELSMRVSYDRAADHLATLLAAATDDAKIVVSSRTQHFKSRTQVLTALGERVGLQPYRRILSVEDFTTSQIRQYLINYYQGDELAAESRLTLIGRVEDLGTLSRNPRLLSFAAELEERQLEMAARAGRALSAAMLYREIITRWLEVEERRTIDASGLAVGLRVKDMFRAVTRLALRLWEANEPTLRLGELQEIADTLTGLAEGQLSAEQTAHAVGAGSLLIRTDEAQFGFIHSSVAEWLVANEIAAQLNRGVPSLLTRRGLSQLCVDFLCDLADARPCRAWAQTILADRSADQIARANALNISRRLTVPANTDLRDVSLVGEDLSYRDLSRVDASHADLSDALLIGTTLVGARLRDARLAGTRLDDAVMTGADLTGADLSRARLTGADLRGVITTDSRWSRAALVNVKVDDDFAGRPELRGASIWPGMPVRAEVAPATVGVPYGFHNQWGRLPDHLAYSPDGTMLVVGGENSVLICDAPTGQPVRSLVGHLGRVYAVTFGIDESTLITGASDGTLRVWDLPSGRTRHVFGGHQQWVWPVAASPRLPMVATSDQSGVVRLWDTATGQMRLLDPAHKEPVYSAVFQASGVLLATAGSDGTARVWHSTTGEPVHEFAGHTGAVYRLAFSPQGDLLATADEAGTVRLCSLDSGTERHRLVGHANSVYTMAFHPTARLLATADTDGVIRIWDTDSGETVNVLQGHPAAIYQLSFDPAGLMLASCDANGAVKLWSIDLAASATATLLFQLIGHQSAVWPCVFRPDGKQLATSSNDGTTRLWDTVTGRSQHILRGHGRRVTSVSFDHTGTILAACGNDGAVRLWDPRTGELRRAPLRGTADQLTSAAFSPVDSTLATASNDGGVHLWNAEQGTAEHELDVATPSVWAEAFSPDGKLLATANDDDSLQIWRRRTGAHYLEVRGHYGRIRSISFSPNGETALTGCDDRKIRLCDLSDGRHIASWDAHTDRVYAVAFHPSGTRFASASWDGTAAIWSLDSQEPVHRFTAHVGMLRTAAFNPDGTVLATAGDDMTVRLWDPDSGGHVADLEGHTGRVHTMSFSPDGITLATGGEDGTVRVWDLSERTAPRLRVTLLGLAEGWVAVAPDGTYKLHDRNTGEFWYSIGMCRFEPGELDPHLRDVRELPPGTPFA